MPFINTYGMTQHVTKLTGLNNTFELLPSNTQSNYKSSTDYRVTRDHAIIYIEAALKTNR